MYAAIKETSCGWRWFLTAHDKDETFHWNGSFRCIFMCRCAMPLQIDISMRRAVVVVQTGHVEVDSDSFTLRRSVICSFDLVVPKVDRIDRSRPTIHLIDEVL